MKIRQLIAAALLIAATPALMAQSDAQDRPQRTTGSDASSSSQDGTRNDTSRARGMDSEEFAKKAGAAGHAEVAMGKLGAGKATDAQVKSFAQKMVTDHTKGNQELASAAKAKGLEVPSEPDTMHKAMHKKFQMQQADAEFDQDFMDQMVKDHEAVIELYENAAADSGVDPQLQALAKKMLPTLREHLAQAQSIEKKLGGGSR